ncbi:hypothetical protein GMES_3007 [Paraglaciecola mesophila KMM 241]|uniref:Uncharacterized protein n=1 Tax=Paraglaciecola mesophila KMM 241 TaxID=1128912 RepID=K6Z4K8_9ALTE|nr:hypothetical protein GMES_3007 [Paraglaciecola mesophila KMM 241]
MLQSTQSLAFRQVLEITLKANVTKKSTSELIKPIIGRT